MFSSISGSQHMFPARRGQPVLQPSCNPSRSVNPTFPTLRQSCHILALLSISFSVFLFFSHQIISVVSLSWSSFFIRFRHMSQPSQPLLSQKLFPSLYTRHHFTNLLIVYFIFQRFPTYHSQHSHFCSLQLPFIFHFQCPAFSTTGQSNSHTAFV